MMWIKAGICSGSLLDYLYRGSGACPGGLMGSLIHFNTERLGFDMTALSLVIFLKQLRKEKKHDTAVIGFLASACCLYFPGPDSFIIPSMIIMPAILTIFRNPIEKAGAPLPVHGYCLLYVSGPIYSIKKELNRFPVTALLL